MASTLNTLKETDVQKMLSFEIEDAGVGTSAAMIEYSGFNPIVTFNLCMKKIKNDKDRKNKLVLLIIFGLTRGFGSKKSKSDILEKTTEDGRDELDAAFSLFDVDFSGDRKRNTITVSRIMAAFPVLVYNVQQVLIRLGRNKNYDFSSNLPINYMYPGSPAMMSEETWEELQENYLQFIEQLNILWNQTTDYERDLKFALLAYKSPLAPQSSRQ